MMQFDQLYDFLNEIDNKYKIKDCIDLIDKSNDRVIMFSFEILDNEENNISSYYASIGRYKIYLTYINGKELWDNDLTIENRSGACYFYNKLMTAVLENDNKIIEDFLKRFTIYKNIKVKFY